MKIIIVGAGISGLASYLNLKKFLPEPLSGEPHTIIIYESHQPSKDDAGNPTSDISAGGGLGVSPNGISELEKLDPELRDAVVAQGFPTRGMQMRNSWGWILGCVDTSYSGSGKLQQTVMSRRQGIWKCLKDKVPSDALITGRKVTGVRRGENGKSTVVFADGQTDSADVVIGADGVKSVIKDFVVGDGYQPHYEGLAGVGGWMPSSKLPSQPENCIWKAPNAPVVMTFGAEGFFGYSPADSGKKLSDAEFALPEYGSEAMWWSSFEETEEPKDTKNFDKNLIREQLIERHKNWKDPVVQDCIRNAEISLFLPSWVTPELPKWHNDGVVLIGDAAHALPTSSGQGVSQCLEDAHALSYLLAHYLRSSYVKTTQDTPALTEAEAVELAARKYTTMRKPRVKRILHQAQRMAGFKKKQGVIGQWFTYLFLKILFKFMPASWQNYLYTYDVEAEAQRVIGMADEEYAKAYAASL
ncbi:hypothetical protein GP486_004024 [Trichoglossum hirsutum]|uniref:FAD-binding domain-containing protein n=1 Tax=Trichoglossum hirsutum TaxID=265104 RepID=A0A9P8LC49_9PEZI|nr:hypothetical protein GP486_004024 [Trichoglossum hirsutum]